MPNIEIEQADFDRLKLLAEPLVDTPATVVRKLLDGHFASNSMEEGEAIFGEPEAEMPVYSFYDAPPLVHVKMVAGNIGLHTPKKSNWDSMVAMALELVLAEINDVKRATAVLDLNAVVGKKEDDGYKYLPELNASYQGVSAQHAAKVIANAAKFLKVDAYVDFLWRNKKEAYAPGKSASLSFVP